MKNLFCFIMSIVSFCLASCQSEEDSSRTEVVTVASETRLVSSGSGVYKAYLVKEEGKTGWTALPQGIGNIDFREGHEYQIKALVTKNADSHDGVQDEWYDENWTCQEIISDEVKNSEGLPAQADAPYITLGYCLFKVELLTPTGRNLLDSLGVISDESISSVVYSKAAASNLFSVKITKDGGAQTIDTSTMDYWIEKSKDGKLLLSIRFLDEGLWNKGSYDDVYVTTISSNSSAVNMNDHTIKWYVHAGTSSCSYDAYKCEVDGEDYSLASDALYMEGAFGSGDESMQEHRLLATLSIKM